GAPYQCNWRRPAGAAIISQQLGGAMIERKRLCALIVSSAFALTSLSASAQPAPQTARQALLEMFFSKTPGTFEKHLPQATRAAMRKAGATSGAPAFGGLSA